MTETVNRLTAKKAACILLAFTFVLSGFFIFRPDAEAFGDYLQVTASADKETYGFNDTVKINVTVENTIKEAAAFTGVSAAPVSDCYYCVSGASSVKFGTLPRGESVSTAFELKLSYKADNLNFFRRVVLFFRYLFSSGTPLDAELGTEGKKIVTVPVNQGGHTRNVKIAVYYDAGALATLPDTSRDETTVTEPEIMADRTVPVGPVSSGEALTVTMLDVGQGLSMLIRCDDEYMIYDGGGRSRSSYVVAYLKDKGITDLKYMVASHYDEDHISGLVGVLNTVTVGTVICPDYTKDTAIYNSFITKLGENGAAVEHPDAGTAYSLGSATVTTLTPAVSSFSEDNNRSIAVKVEYKDFSCIITGDCETKAEAFIVDNGYASDCDLYVAGHHGSSSSSSEKFIQAIKPEYAFISCGASNSYGHPTAQTLATFAKYNVKFFRSDDQGEVTCATDGINYRFSCDPSENTSPGGSGVTTAAVTSATSSADTTYLAA